jgi:hypothetical protein
MPSRQVFRLFSPKDLPREMTLKQGQFVKKNSTQRSDPASSAKFNAANVLPVKKVPPPVGRDGESLKKRGNRERPRGHEKDQRKDEL